MSNKPPATTLKPDGKPALTPKLRFREFQDAGAWEKKSLSKVVHLVSGLHLSPDQYGKEGDVPYFTGPSDFTNNIQSIARWTKESTCVAVESDTLITVKGSGVGAIWNLTLPSVAIGRQLMAVRARGSSSRFVYQFLLTKRTRFEDLASGNLIPGLSRGDILDLEAPFPTVSEQERIADCLCSADELIAAQDRKVAVLKTHKKWLMQQLFPREGETQPRLRFPEFQDAEEWIGKRLDQLVDIQSGGTPSKANPAFWNGSVPWVSAKDMKRFFLEDAQDHISTTAIDDGAILVPAGTLLMLTRGMTLLKDVPICVVRREMSFNQDVKALRPKDELDGLFLAWTLTGNKQRLLKMVDIAGHGTGKLNTDELKAFELTIPEPAEQQRIASCLSSLDDLISAQTQKLDAFKTQKTGLMQQLFLSPEDVEA